MTRDVPLPEGYEPTLRVVNQRADGCPFCDIEGHHVLDLPPMPIETPRMRDAMWHTLTQAALVLAQEGRVPEALFPLMEAIGWITAEARHVGESHGRESALRDFFAELVEMRGYGTYEIEITKDMVQAPRAH